MKTIAITLVALILSTSGLVAQDYEFKNITKATKKSSGSIYNDNVLTGYYFFYLVDKLEGGKRGYRIEVLDANLKLTFSESLPMNQRTILLETAYNGNNMLFKFYDGVEHRVEYRILDKEGKMSKPIHRELDKYEDKLYRYQASTGNIMGLSSPNDQGFIDIVWEKPKAMKYRVTYIRNNGEIAWDYSPEITKGMKGGSFLVGSDQSILILESSAKSVTSKDRTFSLMALNYEGEEVFNIPLESDLYNLMPHNAFVNKKDGGFALIGEHYNKAEKMVKAESEGVFLRGISEDGLWKKEEFLDWEKDIKPKMTAEEYDQAKKFSIFFHDVIRTKEGNIIAIGEQYKKSASALGIASKVAGDGEVSTVALKVGNMIMLEINPNIELEDVYVFDKKDNTIDLPSGYAYVNKHVLGKFLASAGLLDFEFVQFNKDASVATIAFTDKVKEKGKINKQAVVQLVSYVDEDNAFTKDKISLKTEATALWVDRAKPGHILIKEYYRKEKVVKYRLEPINF
jgi:hypothetical protein